MKTTTPITLAIPGEKRNAKQIKDLLLSVGLITEYDREQDIFDIPKLGARAVSMRSQDAVKFLLDRNLPLVINGIDIFTENLLSRRMKVRQENPNSRMFSESIVGFDPLPPKTAPDIYSDTKSMRDRQAFSLSTTFDTLPVSRLRLLVPESESAKLSDIGRIARRGDILTSYPYLVRTVLARAYGGGYVGSIQQIEGKVEALLASGFGRSAVDIVDTGDTAKKNNLAIGPTLFESYPALISSDEAVSEDVRVRSIVDALTMISNALYENTPEYREKYPRG